VSFRFHKRLRIFPGLWINLSKKGGSLSAGGRGAAINVSPQGHQESVGLPGSGMSYRTKRRKFCAPGAPVTTSRHPVTAAHVWLAILVVLIILWLLSQMH
jgi:hypothetical protein